MINSRNDETTEFNRKYHIKFSIFLAFMMFISSSFVQPFIDGEKITLVGVLLGIIIWPLAGLLYFNFVKRYYARKTLN